MSNPKPLTPEQIRAAHVDAAFVAGRCARNSNLLAVASTVLQVIEEREALIKALSDLLDHQWVTLTEKFEVQDAADEILQRCGAVRR